MTSYLKYDYIIIGCGLAGLYTALKLSEYGKVVIISKSTLEISNSYWAQGGVAAAVGHDDTTDEHYEDTLNAGRGICKKEAVKILVNEGKDRILELLELGVPFDKDKNEIELGLEGGHKKRRILHAEGSATGKALVEFISPLVLSKGNVEFLENTFVYRLLINEEVCYGLCAYNFEKGKSIVITGNAVVVAAGGGSAIYSRTTNPNITVGDGISLAYNADTEIESMEFIQFHPTAFYANSGETFLISEAVRGEGAYVVNNEVNRFLQEQDVSELAPRDVVSAAIFNELKNSGKQNVFLKLDHLDHKKIKSRFSGIYSEAKNFGIDITRDPVPVAPAAHYTIGGIKTGLDGETNIERLYAVGEAASTGVHGANRLASNSLLECIVFGKRAAEHISNIKRTVDKLGEKNFDRFHVNEKNEKEYVNIRGTVSRVLWDNVGIVRSGDSLKFAEGEFSELSKKYGTPAEEYYLNEIFNLVEIAKLITGSAIIREESRGCHIRRDFAEEDRKFAGTIIQQKNEGVKLII